MDGKDFIPKQTPPFVIITLTDQNGHACKNLKSLGKFVQLPKEVKKESYGDLLENYTEVKNFCDTIQLDDRFMKLGDFDTCNLESVCKSNFHLSDYAGTPIYQDNEEDDLCFNTFDEDLEELSEDLANANEDLDVDSDISDAIESDYDNDY